MFLLHASRSYKFAPNRLFSQIASSYNHSDVFTIEELKQLCQSHATCFVEDGMTIFTRWDALGVKCSNLPGIRKLHDFLSNLPGIRKLHDFLILRPGPDEAVIMKV